jgi:hypothetical protein
MDQHHMAAVTPLLHKQLDTTPCALDGGYLIAFLTIMGAKVPLLELKSRGLVSPKHE